MTKQQAHRSKKLDGYYTRQFSVTTANKQRRAERRHRRKVDIARRAMLKKIPRHETKPKTDLHAGTHHA